MLATRPMRRRRASGAAAVEFAIVVPLLLLLVLGTIDWGWYFFTRAVVVNASREGARTGTLYSDASQAASEAGDAVEKYLDNGGLDSAKLGSGLDVDVTTDSVSVQITYPAGSLTGFLKTIMPEDVVARAEMRR